MFLTHCHLIFSHLPAIALGIGVLVMIYGLARRSCAIVRTGLMILILAALVAVPAYLTGDRAASDIRNLPDFVKTISDEHEEASTIALVAVIVAGLSALAGIILLARKKTCGSSVTITVLIISLMALGLMIHTANLGIRINHPESRAGFVTPPVVEEND